MDLDNAEAMNRTSAEIPFGESEIEFAGLHTVDSVVVAPPRIAESPVSIECEEWSTMEIGAQPDRDRVGEKTARS